jgi:hypothetical protein
MHLKPLFRIKSLLVAVIAATIALSQGCAEHEASVLLVQFNRQLEADCSLRASGAQVVVRPRGYLDLSVTNEYLIFPQLLNGLRRSSVITGKAQDQLQAENSHISIRGAKINYIVADIGIELPQNQFVFTSGSIAPFSQSLVEAQAIPPLVGEFLRAAPALQERYSSVEMIVEITFEGELQDGTTVRSNRFAYPITVCRGCLINYPVSPEFCCAPEAWGNLTFPCFPGQDDPFDCRSCCATAITAEQAAECLP